MFTITESFLYRLLFMVELLSAELIFAWSLERRSHFAWRLFGVSVLCALTSVLFEPLGNNAWFCSLTFFSLFALTVAGMKFCFKASFKDVCFCCISGFTIQHLTHEFIELINVIFNLKEYVNFDFYGDETIDLATFMGNISIWMLYFTAYFFIYIAVYAGMYYLFAKQINKCNVLCLNSGIMTVFVSVIFFVDVLFSALVIYSITAQTPELILLHIYNVVCCIFVLIIFFEIPKRKNVEQELIAYQYFTEKEKQQYSWSKENIELINIKCHDLKHQIRRIGKENEIDKGVILEISDMIDIYDSTYKTDNEALNVILTEKSLICKKEDIEFSCIVDGAILSNMASIDIYSLFGNLLDNAIEAVRSLEKGQRVIGFFAKALKGVVLIKIYNNYAGEIEFEDDLPVTNKLDKSLHGFGLRSVRRIVEKYHGEVTISIEDQIFEINIVLPM